eukprot:g2823.t1
MTARVCQMFLSKGIKVSKKRNPANRCAFANSCPNFGQSNCGLMDVEDLCMAAGTAKESKRTSGVCSSRKNTQWLQENSSTNFNVEKTKVMSPISLQRHAFDLSSQNNATRSTTIPEKHGSDAEPLPNLKGTQTKTRETMIENSCYKRQLSNADPTLVPFNSRKGRQLFGKAFETNLLDGSYWDLAENYSTQSEPSFCALTSLVMALNSLGIDPKRKAWSSKPEIPWRWYTEESLVSCCNRHKTLSEVNLSNGMSIKELCELAQCQQGVRVRHFYPLDEGKPNHSSRDDFLASPIPVNEDVFRQDLLSISLGHRDSIAAMATNGVSNSEEDYIESCSGKRMIVNFSRKELQQTGEHGHFSCIGAYEADSDMALVMETARFKYPPFWVPTSLLYKAMVSTDPDSGFSRGYLLVEREEENMNPQPQPRPDHSCDQQNKNSDKCGCNRNGLVTEG